MSWEFCQVVVPPLSTECLSSSNLHFMTASLFSVNDVIIRINLCWLRKKQNCLVVRQLRLPLSVCSEGRGQQGWGPGGEGALWGCCAGQLTNLSTCIKNELRCSCRGTVGMLLSFFPSQPS